MMTKRLGRGLGELISHQPEAEHGFVMVPTGQIKPGGFQPRQTMSESSMEELKASIRRSGVVEPVIVRRGAEGVYELIAGERRFRAAQALGLSEIPAIVRALSDQEALEVALVENVQREELNPLEEARGYVRLIDQFGYTQEGVGEAVGKDRATIANLLRLLSLPEELQRGLLDGVVTLGHAKVLLSVADRATQTALYREVISSRLSVRETERLAAKRGSRRSRSTRPGDPQLDVLEGELRRVLGTKVRLMARKKGGRMIVDYFSTEDLTRILQVLGVAV